MAVTAAVATACGGGGSPSPSTSATASASATATPATPSAELHGPALVVWAVQAGSSEVVRTLTPSGGSAHTIATLPSTATVLGAGGGKLAWSNDPATLHLVSLASGADATFPTGGPAGANVLGAAVSPDGTQVIYVTTRGATPGGSLRLLSVASGTSLTLQTYSGNVDAPQLWTPTDVEATTLVPASDAGPQTAVTLDPATGDRTRTTNIAGAGQPAYSWDGVHAADGVHTPGLGDDGEGTGPGGPPGPLNTLRIFSVGSSPTVVYQRAHHNVNVLAMSTNGAGVLFANDPSAGGFAGISMSPDFGLFIYRGSTAVQVERFDGPRWDAGAFIDMSTAAAARNTGAGIEQLTLVGGSHTSPAVIDSVAGGDQPVFVGYSPIS